jgi:hypothetical protein
MKFSVKNNLFKDVRWFKSSVAAVLATTLFLQTISISVAAIASDGFPIWAYDGGPDPKTAMGKELIDLNSRIPHFPSLSDGLYGPREQKFRPLFGPIPWRMRQEPNSVKILFIGQDGTHIAEAAGRPATAGFGGRAQDLAEYFGVTYSAAFMNAYAFTIKGQYGSFKAPMVRTKPDGTQAFAQESFVDNQLWLMSNDQESPLAQWRNGLIDWIIRNNRDSLQMIVLFGNAARDAAAVYVESKGGKVGTRYSPEEIATFQVPEMDLKSAGGNNQVPIPYTKSGKDLYSVILGKDKPNYMSDQETRAEAPDLTAAKEALSANLSKYLPEMAFSKGGIGKSGVIHPAQIGGYDIDRKMEVNGRRTISLKGLKISNDYTVTRDILITQLPHPSSLSMMKGPAASKAVADDLQGIKSYAASGWKIQPDAGQVNSYAAGKPFNYGRGEMGPEYYDFGAPASRMVNVSTASRSDSGLDKWVDDAIIFGTRDKAGFDRTLLKAMAQGTPSTYPSNDEMWTARARIPATRYIFDAGPGEKYARLMKENIPASLVKSHAVNGDYAHYRGTFVKPQVLILADPEGYDDLITARALTGSRGQYLHSLMVDLGVNDQYLVLKTAPFSNEEKDWESIFEQTKTYREVLLRSVLAESKPKLIIADGDYAAREIDRIVGTSGAIPVVKIERTVLGDKPKADAVIASKSYGIDAAISRIKGLGGDFNRNFGKVRMTDIPRSQLTYYARLWEGTSGDRVITSFEPEYKGSAFSEVIPAWAYNQKFKTDLFDQTGIQKLNEKLMGGGLRKGGESVPNFLKRVDGRRSR